MYGDLYGAVQTTKMRIDRAEKQAQRAERFKGIRSKEQVVVTSVLTSILGLFLR
jgi:hypothetical protein